MHAASHGMARERITTSPELVHFHGVLVENMPVKYVHGVRPIKAKEACVLREVPKAKAAAKRAPRKSRKSSKACLEGETSGAVQKCGISFDNANFCD